MPLDILTPHRLDYAHPVNWDAPLNRGLLGWWQVLPRRMGGARLLDLTGRWPMALTGFGASSTTQGWGPTRRPGGWGELRFLGAASNQGAVPPIPSLFNAPAVTLAGWAWQQTLDVIGYIWNQFLTTATQWSVETWNDGFLYIELNPGTATYGSIDYSTVMAAQTWTHLAVVFQGSGATNPDRLKLYVNGVPKALAYGGTIPSVWPDLTYTPTPPIIFGRTGQGTGPWNGKLDDWRLWNRVLAPPEVQQLYLRSRLRYPQELRWRSPLHVVPLLGYEAAAEVTEPGAVPAGLTVLWSGTAASIPSGWTRATALDSLYPRGAAAAAEPGSGGGALTHTHTSTAHSHTTAHTHTVPASASPTGTTARDAGTTNPPLAHTHPATVTVDPSTTTATDTPSTDSGSLEPPYAEVLFLRSAGTSIGFPALTLALWNEAGGLPSGWELADGTSGKPDLRGRYLKGAPAAGNGGGSGGAATHSHTLASHTHSTPYAHAHPDVTSPQRSEALTAGDVSGATAATATATHTHALTMGSANGAITGATDGVSTVNHEPPFWVQAFIQNVSGALSWPNNLIALWTGALASIPANWKLCDGTQGTPDLRSVFVKGATTLADIGQTGGALSHTHTATGHTHAVAAHTHTVTGAAGAGENRTAGAVNAPTTAHTHTWANTGSTGFTSGSSTPTVDALSTTTPPYTTVVFVQWQAPGAVATLTQAAQTVTSDGDLALAATTSLTQAAQTVSSAGVLPLLATSSVTQAAQTLVATGQAVSAITGTVAVTQADQTGTSAGAVALQATSALTQTAQTASSAGGLALRATTALTQAPQTLSSAGVLPVTATSSVTQVAQTLTSAGTLPLLGTVGMTQAAQTLAGLGAHEGPFVQGRWPFGRTGATTIPGTVHGLGTANLLVQVYDAASPATQLQAQVTVHPTTQDVQVQFVAATAGTVLVSAMTLPSAGKLFAVADGLSLVYLGTEHGRGLGPLFVQLYDASGVSFEAQIQVAPATGDVLVGLTAARDGRIVVAAPSSAPTPAQSATPFSSVTSVTVPAATHGRGSASLLVEVYDAATPARLLQAPLTVHPSTQAVTATFLVAQSGTLVIGGGTQTGTGSVALMQAAQTSSSTGRVALAATTTLAQAAQTVTSTSLLALAAGAALAQAAQTSSSTGALALTATTALMQAAQTSSSAGVLALHATTALTQAAQTLASIGGSQAMGLVSLTQAAQTVMSTGTLPLLGTSSVTQAAQTLLSTGLFLRLGAAALTQAPQTATSTGTLSVQGTSTLTQAAQTLSSAAASPRQGTSTLTQAAQTGSSTGTLALVGASALTQAPQTLSSAGFVLRQGTLAAAQAPQLLSSTGTLALAGASSVTQAPQTASSTGTLRLQATASLTQAPQGLGSTGALGLAGTLTLTQDAQALLSTGSLALGALLAVTQDAATLTAIGTHLGALTGAAFLVQDAQELVAVCAPTPPMPLPATGTLTRVEYPTEVHFFTPTGALVKIVPKIRQPELRRYPRREPL